jgi:HAD superfamily hydrolase (TIGR01490 family)
MDDKIEAMRLPKAQALVDHHRDQGHKLMVITATNQFVTEPIVHSYGIQTLLATEGEIVDGFYTGEISGIPCFAEGKVERLRQWLTQTNSNLKMENSYFYSDSRNDIPLLEQVSHPVAVDPDDTLREHAEKQKWKIISLRD